MPALPILEIGITILTYKAFIGFLFINFCLKKQQKMIFNLPCMSTDKTTKHFVVKTLSKTQLNETRSYCIASEEKKRRKQSFISRYKKKEK